MDEYWGLAKVKMCDWALGFAALFTKKSHVPGLRELWGCSYKNALCFYSLGWFRMAHFFDCGLGWLFGNRYWRIGIRQT